MKRLCTICARGGSKGVKNKNIRSLHGKPLIAYSIMQARESGLFEAIAVSSDSKEILEIARNYGATYLINRPGVLASDRAAKLPAIRHCVAEAESLADKYFDVIVDLDATSPLRTVDDIRNSVDLLEMRKVSNVISGCEARRSPYFNLVEVDKRGNVHLSKSLPEAIVRRQDSPKCYDMNASIYVWHREALFNNNSIFNADTLLYEMPEDRSFDIDSELDFEFVSCLMGKMNKSIYSFLFDLTGKTAIVTGGAGILGKNFCEGLAAHGANVVVVDIDREAACDLATQLKGRYSGKFLGIGCDVSDPVDVVRMVEETTRTLGGIQILHNNAAWKSTDLEEFYRRFEEYRLDQWRKIMSVNIDGMFLVAQAVGKQMLQQGTGGSIIQTSSIYGIMAPDQRIYEGSENLGVAINTPAVYSASKAAVVGLTKYLAAYWADQGIRVNALTPGGNESGQNEVFVRRYSSRVPMGRMAKPTEMVGALLYLASDASSYVTGQNVVVDGGLSCW